MNFCDENLKNKYYHFPGFFCVILNFIESEQDINNLLIILIYSIFNKR